jgi:hypothetical protein
MVPIKDIALEVVRKVYRDGQDPNQAFLAVFKNYPEATEHHKRRVIELANRALFQLYYNKGQHEHPLVDPAIVLGAKGSENQKSKASLKKAASQESTSTEPVDPSAFEIDVPEQYVLSNAEDDTDLLKKEASWDEVLKEAELKTLLRGTATAIPRLDKVAHLLDRDLFEYLVLRKEAGAVEDDELTERVLELAADLGLG